MNLRRIFREIGNWFKRLPQNVVTLVPIAINVVEGIKKVMDSPIDDVILFIIKNAIPGSADDVIIDKTKVLLEEWIPKILIILRGIDEVSGTKTEDEILNDIISDINTLNDESKAAFYHNFATLILEKLTDGKLTKSECIILTEYYYKNNVGNAS